MSDQSAGDPTTPVPTGDAAVPTAAPATAPLPTAAVTAERPSRHLGRRITTWVLVVVVGMLTPLVLATGWARLLLVSQTAYLDAVAPLVLEPEVIAALEDRTTDAVMQQVEKLNLDDQVTTWLGSTNVPPRVTDAVSVLMASLNAGLRNVVSDAAAKVYESPQFAQLWTTVNTVAHKQLVAILDGSSVLLNDEGAVSLQLQPVIAAVRQHLVDNGNAWASRIPDVDVQYVLVDADTTHQAQQIYKLGTTTVWVLFALTLVCATAAVLLSLNRLIGFRRVAFAVMAGALVLGAALRFTGTRIDDAAANLRHPAAAAEIFNTTVLALRTAIQVTAVVALFVALVTYLFGQGWAATSLRRGLAGGPGTQRAVIITRVVAAVLALTAGGLLLFADLSTGWSVTMLLAIAVALVLFIWAAQARAPKPGDADPLAVGAGSAGVASG